MRKNVGAAVGGTISLMAHGVLMLWLVQLPDPDLPGANTAHADTPDIPLISALPLPEGARAGQHRVEPVPVVFGGPDSAQNLDTGRDGWGGDARASRAALLAERAHAIFLQDTPPNAIAVSQRQRIATADDRASWENRRATPNPNDQPFLASGQGEHRERRPVSERDAQRGAPVASPRGTLGAEADASGVNGRAAGPGEQGSGGATYRATAGGEHSSPGVGIARGRGSREAQAADVARGRPPVDEGPAATTATNASRVRDNTDAELLASQLTQSWVDATPGAAPNPGRGRGGAGSSGAAGAGGSMGAGGRASPHTPGPGSGGALDTRDRRYRQWYVSALRRVRSRMRFPSARELAMDQGVVVYRLVVDANGNLVGDPRLARTSGFADINAAALRAIRSAAPFGPLPSEWLRGQRTHSFRLSLTYSNPLVR